MEQHPLFSSRDTLDEALVYGVNLINSLPAMPKTPEEHLAFFIKIRESRG